MSTSDVTLILSRIEDLHRELAEVKAEVKATNGTVRGLLIWRAKIDGAMWIVGRVPVIAAIAASAAAVFTVLH